MADGAPRRVPTRPADGLATMWEGVEAVPPVQHGILSKTAVGEWDLLRPLGEGEFAKVQACRRAGETVVYACKHISKARLVCASNIKRTLRRVRRVGTEITAMQTLRHKNICQLVDVVHTPEYVHVIMENGGRDLYEVIGENSNQPISIAMKVSHSLASALAHCLEHGVVHRDLKPENVLVKAVSPESQEIECIKLCDFGLCAIAPPVAPAAHGASPDADARERVSPDTVLEAGAVQAGAVARQWVFSDFSGSPGFVAPEIVTEEAYDGRYVDAWSLGCVVLELVSGHGTFDHVWMNAYAHETMCDKRAFLAALDQALVFLHKLPNFVAPPAALAAAAADGAAAPPRLSLLGDFVLSLLKIDPLERLEMHNACRHPWLADLEKAAQAQSAEESKVGDPRPAEICG